MLDIALDSRINRRCDGLGRREFLRIGGLSVLGLSLAQLLKSEAAAATSSANPMMLASSVRPNRSGRPRRSINPGRPETPIATPAVP